jgi:glyoxylase-like metal-dependent hydrolase (beta-lactamase superfamily II)
MNDASLNGSSDIRRPCTVAADHYLIDGESVTVAGITLQMIYTPGHTEGSCCFYMDAEQTGGSPILISGDTLFEESVGRTDLPTGDMHDLVESVRGKLFALPDNTIVYPGHGGFTSIEHEKKYNYYV